MNSIQAGKYFQKHLTGLEMKIWVCRRNAMSESQRIKNAFSAYFNWHLKYCDAKTNDQTLKILFTLHRLVDSTKPFSAGIIVGDITEEYGIDVTSTFCNETGDNLRTTEDNGDSDHASTGTYDASIDSGFAEMFTNFIVNAFEIASRVGIDTVTHEWIQHVLEKSESNCSSLQQEDAWQGKESWDSQDGKWKKSRRDCCCEKRKKWGIRFLHFGRPSRQSR